MLYNVVTLTVAGYHSNTTHFVACVQEWFHDKKMLIGCCSQKKFGNHGDTCMDPELSCV